MSTGDFIAITGILVAIICGPCFFHYHSKFTTDKGRSDVLMELRSRRLMTTYIHILIQLVRIIHSRSGRPFSLRSFGFSITLSQAYSAFAIALSVALGGSGKIGEFNVIRHSSATKELVRFEAIMSGSFFIIIFLAFYIWDRWWSANRSELNSDSAKLRYFQQFSLFSLASGMIYGMFAGTTIFLIPSALAIFIGFKISRIESVIIVTFVSAAAGYSLLSIEDIAKYGTPHQLPSESMVGNYLPDLLVLIPLYFMSRVLGPMLHGFRGSYWSGFGLSLIALTYLMLGLIVHGHVTESLMMVLITWIVLPAINALNDYLSLGVSHFLLLRIIASRGKRFLEVLSYAILDLLFAFLLLFQSAVTIPLVLAITSQITGVGLDLQSFIMESRNDLFGHGLWLSIMIISTLTYTVVHLFLAFVALVFQMSQESPIHRTAIASIQGGHDSLMTKFYLSSRWVFIMLLSCLMLFLMPFLTRIEIGQHNVGTLLVDTVESVAQFGSRLFPH